MVALITLCHNLQQLSTDAAGARSLKLPMAVARKSLPKDTDSTSLTQASQQLKEGDVVFRAGRSWLTNMAEQFADEAVRYSHVGVVVKAGDDLKVVHASIEPDEGQKVVADPLDVFLKKGKGTQAAVYRLKSTDAETQSAIATSAKAYARKAIPFDPGFDLTTSDRVYCSELVWRIYLEAGIDLSDYGLEQFDFPFSGKYITPDSLSASASLTPIYYWPPLGQDQALRH